MPSPNFKFRDNPWEIIRDLNKPKLFPETGWNYVGPSEAHGINFTSNIGNAGTISGVTNAPASWYTDDGGETRWRGKITGAAEGDTLFDVLPPEIRPEYSETFICAVDGGGKANIRVDIDGTVTVESITT